LSGIYEKPSANNKVHLMKKLFNLKMSEDAFVAQHLNEFNTITNKLPSVEIEFEDEIHTLIVLASLPNSWEVKKMAVSNYVGKSKLKYKDFQDLILGEEVYKRDSGEASCFGATLNLETRGRNSDRGRSRSRKGRSKSRSSKQPQYWNSSKTEPFKKNCKEPRKKTGKESAKLVTRST
jgi:hypothetical protein